MHAVPVNPQVVPPSMAGSEHFTMSASGVVHLIEGESSESIPLSVWVQRKSVYNLLKGITFFGKFPLVKVRSRSERGSRQMSEL